MTSISPICLQEYYPYTSNTILSLYLMQCGWSHTNSSIKDFHVQIWLSIYIVIFYPRAKIYMNRFARIEAKVNRKFQKIVLFIYTFCVLFLRDNASNPLYPQYWCFWWIIMWSREHILCWIESTASISKGIQIIRKLLTWQVNFSRYEKILSI